MIAIFSQSRPFPDAVIREIEQIIKTTLLVAIAMRQALSQLMIAS